MKKILIADDEPDILKIVKFRLMKQGYDVHFVVNGKEAIEQLEKINPDLVLLDYSMPFVNGDEVCIHIKSNSNTQHIPVIIMTASTKIMDDGFIERVKADGKILKPFEPEELLTKIKNLI